MNKRTLLYLCPTLLLTALASPLQARTLTAEEILIQQLELAKQLPRQISDAERVIQELERIKQLPKQLSAAEWTIQELERAKREKQSAPDYIFQPGPQRDKPGSEPTPTKPQLPDIPKPPIVIEPMPIPPSKVIVTPPAVPVPAAVWLFSSGLLALAGAARRRSTC